MIAKAATLAALTATAFAAGLLVAQTTGQSGREPQFDNADAKVWKSTILPHSPLPLHRHEHARIIVALTGGTMSLVPDHGPAETHVWQTGKAYWLPAMPPGVLHQDVNVGDKPIEVMVIEMEKTS